MRASDSQLQDGGRVWVRLGATLLAVFAVAMFAVVAGAAARKHHKPVVHREPPISVSRSKLSGAFFCHTPKTPNATAEPVLLVPGIGISGDQAYRFEEGALNALGLSVCDVDLPNYGTADIQTSVQYLVYAIRRDFTQSHRPIAVLGLGQGGILARMALVYWKDLRNKVADVVAVASAEHGTTVPSPPSDRPCSKTNLCTPAVWQQARKAHILTWLGKHHAEAPGPTSWTTIRSDTDDVVRPQTEPRPTSSLKRASNILIQSVCPGRVTSHAATAFDSVTFAALFDAVTQPGAASISRFPNSVCATPYAKGLEPRTIAAVLRFIYGAADRVQLNANLLVRAEPKVKKYFKH